jgi:hypothetical protein
MGLLDEAIREHLDLKRRRGADASEVSLQEQEALGPARRGPEPLEVPPDHEAPVLEPDDPESELEPHANTAPVEHDYREPEAPPAEPVHELPAAGEAERPSPEPPLQDAEPVHELLAADEAEPPSPGPPPQEAHDAHPAEQLSRVGEETMAFDVASEIAQEDEVAHGQPAHEHEQPAHEPAAPAGQEHEETPAHEPAEEAPPADAAAAEEAEPEPHPDDVLEETPEFLQETPEHDRLWFEQRPPKDFDFDK